jgi:hypothetical protein
MNNLKTLKNTEDNVFKWLLSGSSETYGFNSVLTDQQRF